MWTRLFLLLRKSNIKKNVSRGFYCRDHNYGNTIVKRIATTIHTKLTESIIINLSAKTCEISKLNKQLFNSYIVDRMNTFNMVLQHYGFACYSEIRYSEENGWSKYVTNLVV